jgi:hypothetical protein
MADTPAKKAAASSAADKADTDKDDQLSSSQAAGAVDLAPLIARDDDRPIEELTWAEQAYPELTPEEQQALQEQRDATIREFGKYEAVQQIRFGSALAANPGDRVPISVVEKYGMVERGLVKEIGA